MKEGSLGSLVSMGPTQFLRALKSALGLKTSLYSFNRKFQEEQYFLLALPGGYMHIGSAILLYCVRGWLNL